MARELDERAASGTELRVIFLEHADAEQLLPVLQQLLGQAATLPANGDASQPTANGDAAWPAPQPVSVASGASVFGNKSAVVTRFEEIGRASGRERVSKYG